jgi:type I restriction enzyme S subunit
MRIVGYSQTYSAEGLAQSKLWDKPTLCMTIAGENTGSTAILDFPACFPDSIVGFVPDPEKADIRYVKHALDSMRQQFRGVSKGATQDNLSIAKILSFPLRVPVLPIQKKIASIIAAYDDLIENNRRRIALLEEAARMLYREWFVRFRFPGHEHVKIIDGIPEGWKKTVASAVMDVLSGGTPKTENPNFWHGDIGFFTPKDATDTPYALETEKTITDEGLRACNSRLYPIETIFMTARGTVGKLNLALVSMAMNQSCYALRSKTYVGQRYIYLALKDAIEQVRSRATGAVFNAVIVATFDGIPFLLPPQRLTDIFTLQVHPMFDQIANLIQQNQKLGLARDLLLPRLMKGEIAV